MRREMHDPASEYRPSGRVVLVDGRERVLLLDQGVPEEGGRLWVTPGGGLAPGESFAQGALRELWEETGLRLAESGPLVWTRRIVFRWSGRVIDSDERFFFAHLPDLEIAVAPAALEPHEVATVSGHRWWGVAALNAAPPDTFAPSRIAELLPPLLAGDVPPEPIDVGY